MVAFHVPVTGFDFKDSFATIVAYRTLTGNPSEVAPLELLLSYPPVGVTPLCIGVTPFVYRAGLSAFNDLPKTLISLRLVSPTSAIGDIAGNPSRLHEKLEEPRPEVRSTEAPRPASPSDYRHRY